MHTKRTVWLTLCLCSHKWWCRVLSTLSSAVLSAPTSKFPRPWGWDLMASLQQGFGFNRSSMNRMLWDQEKCRDRPLAINSSLAQ